MLLYMIYSIKDLIVGFLDDLEAEMKLYEAKTIENEEQTNAELKDINANIDDIASIFNSIAGKNA